MLNYRPIVGLILTFVASTSYLFSAAQIPREQVDAYLKDALERYADDNSKAWEDRMYRALATSRDPDQAARILAGDDHLAVDQEKALISLWIAHSLLSESRNNTNKSAELEPKRVSLRR